MLKSTWNPVTGIDIIGNFQLHFYSLLWLLSFLIGFQIMKKIYKKEGVNLEYLEPLFMYTIVATMLGARLGHVLFYQPEIITQDFLSIFLPFRFVPKFEFTGFQGLASHGAAIGIIIGMYLYRKKYPYKTTLWLLDRIVIPVALGGVLIRIGNFINSEIIGKITNSSFGIRFIQDQYSKREAMQLTGEKSYRKAYNAITNNPKFNELLEAVPYRHPTQLYESFCYLISFFILVYFYKKTNKRNKTGFLFGLFLVLIWTIRFFIEFFKEPQVDERGTWLLNTGQLLSIPFVLIGLFFMFIYQTNKVKK